MTSKEFIERASQEIKIESPNYEVHLVWFSKTIQNFKGIFIQLSPDNYMYEVTYNGDKQEMYIDKYDKVKKTEIKL